MKKLAVTVRKVHKFLMVFLGVQFVLWSLSGLYMVAMDIDFIHGDHLVKTPPPITLSASHLLNFQDVIQQYPQATDLKLTQLAQQSVYQFKLKGVRQLISATSGKSLLPFTQENITALVLAHSAMPPEIAIKDIRLLTDEAPTELSSRHLPVWQVNYDDLSENTLYIGAATGKVVTKRHNYWRIFDIVWMLHIMDYENREDITNWLLFIFSITGIFSCLSGLYLVGHRFHFSSKLKTVFGKHKTRSGENILQSIDKIVKGIR